jgi:hypothetical protein
MIFLFIGLRFFIQKAPLVMISYKGADRVFPWPDQLGSWNKLINISVTCNGALYILLDDKNVFDSFML